MDSNKSFVYILHCSDDTYYTGYTTSLTRRLAEHQAGSRKCKYTMAGSRRPVRLAAAWGVEGPKGHALRIEAFIKRLTRAGKMQLIDNPKALSSLYLEEKAHAIECSPVNAMAFWDASEADAAQRV